MDDVLKEEQTEGGVSVRCWVEELQRGTDVEGNSRRLFTRYYGWVRQFFARRGSSRARAEELAQEVFFQGFQRIGSYRGDGSFEAWLFAIAANHWRNERRRLSRQMRDRPEVSIDARASANGPPIVVADGGESPARSVFNNERLRALETAIDQLPEKPRDCVRLRLTGYDYREIAELLRLSPSTARVHVYTARRRLREQFGDDFGNWLD